MPIHCAIQLRDLDERGFDERDSIVMRCAFASQNELGRLCEEQVYENDLALRLRAEGCCNVHTQVPVQVTYGGFVRTYRLDLVADDALYELKTVATLAGEHDAQVLNYAMLTGVRHAKLLNFRTPRVQGRLRCNAVTRGKRFDLSWDDSAWHPLSDQCGRVKDLATGLVNDLGGYLECRLYEDVLVHCFGGEQQCAHRLPVVRNGVQLGSHRMLLHGRDVCFSVTAITGDLGRHEVQLRHLIALTQQAGLQWINLNHGHVQFITLESATPREV
jgi:GxxExxY protein